MRSFPPLDPSQPGEKPGPRCKGTSPSLGRSPSLLTTPPLPPRRGVGASRLVAGTGRPAAGCHAAPPRGAHLPSAGLRSVSAEPLGAPGLRPRGPGLARPRPRPPPPAPERVRPPETPLKPPGPRPRAEAALQPPGSLCTPCGDEGPRRPFRGGPPPPAASSWARRASCVDKPRDQPAPLGVPKAWPGGPLSPPE